MASTTYDIRKAPGNDPREPLFPNYRQFRRHPVASVLVALLLWWALPVAVIAGLAAATCYYPKSPAPIGLMVAVMAFCGMHAKD